VIGVSPKHCQKKNDKKQNNNTDIPGDF